MFSTKFESLRLGALLVFCSIASMGCANLAATLPGATGMTDDQLSTFVIVHENRGNGGIVSFESISDANGSLLRQQNQMTENLRSIKAPPGTYWVTLRVWGYGYTTAFPRTQITAEAGRTYQFSSNSSKNGMAVNATYQAVPPASR